MRSYLSLLYVLGVIAIAAALWFSGVHHGKAIATSACNVERLATLTATNSELVRLKNLAESYAAQVNQANIAREKANLELARLAHLPVPHLLCHTTDSGGSSLPGVPAETSPGAARGGQLPARPERDLGDFFYSEARAADAIVEGCRDVLNRWPQ